MFYWQKDPSKIQQGRKSGKLLKVTIIAVKAPPMVVTSTGASIFQENASKLRRPLDTGSGRTVRTLQKRVELLEAATNGAKCKDDDLHDFKQILCDDLCVPRQKTVHERDFFDVTAYNQVETVPLRHVSFF